MCLNQQLRPLRVDYQPQLRPPRLRAVRPAGAIDCLRREPEFTVLFRAKSESTVFRLPLVIEMPILAPVPRYINPHAARLILRARARANVERNLNVVLFRDKWRRLRRTSATIRWGAAGRVSQRIARNLRSGDRHHQPNR